MIEILTWISLISGGLLILLLLLSLLGGLELDIDIGGDTSVDTDAGGLGIVKSLLTFLSIGSWVVKLVLATDKNPALAFGIGVVAGLTGVFLLGLLLKWLISNQENVNWKPEDALFETGEVYLKMNKDNSGIIKVLINGGMRELKAKSLSKKEIKTGDKVLIESFDNGFAMVSPVKK